MKPGWKTTEFWTTSFAQILALLAFVGVLTPSDSQTLGEALAKAVAAVFTLFVNGTVVIHYVQSRLALKASAGRAANGTASSGATLPLWIAVVLVPLVFTSSPHASLRACGVTTAVAPSTQRTALLPWRAKVEQQLLELQRRQAPPASPAPIIIQPPLQQLPVPGEPRQQLPVPGEPRQQLPVPGDPRQPLPVPGQPLQPVPIYGNPLQPLPYMPPADGNPQSYTIHRALARPIN